VSDDFVDGLVCSIWSRSDIANLADRILSLIVLG
jgi:hypothetical protein